MCRHHQHHYQHSYRLAQNLTYALIYTNEHFPADKAKPVVEKGKTGDNSLAKKLAHNEKGIRDGAMKVLLLSLLSSSIASTAAAAAAFLLSS
jgi:hypothetical protein